MKPPALPLPPLPRDAREAGAALAQPPAAAEVLKAAFDRAPEPRLLIDPVSDSVLRANRAACAIFALTPDELLKRRFSSLYADSLGELLVFTEEAIDRGHAWSRDLVLRRPDGTPMNLEHSLIACPQRERLCLQLAILDLTLLRYRTIDEEANSYHRQGLEEWRRAERFFREIERENQMILSAAGEGIYGVNADGITTFVNHAA